MAENSHVVTSSRSAHRLDDPCKIRTADVLNADNDKRKFSDLHFPEKISTGLASAGFLRPSPVQWAALPLAKIGVDLIVQSKSGTGKTLVYVVTALNMIDTSVSAVQSVILTPTREIAVQGARISLDIAAASMPDFKAATLIGGMSVLDDATKLKRCHMIVGTPGRVRQLIDEKYFKTEAVRFFALDEADKMLESSFKNDVTWIYNQLPEVKQVMALSATYPESLAKSLTSLMRHPQHVRLDTESQVLIGLDQYVLHTTFHPKPKYQLDVKFSALLDVLNSLTFSQCLIFTNYSLSAQSICERLNGNGWPAIYIAATLQNQYERLQALTSLRQFTTRIMVTTDLSARGVDAANVTLVINFDIPWDSRTFLHRSGRAGRFGSRGINLCLASEGDETNMLRKIVFRTGTKIKTIPYQTDNQTDEKGDKDSKVNQFELPDLWKSDKDEIKCIIDTYEVLEGMECPLEEFNVDKQKNDKIVDKDETKENEKPKKKKRGNRKKKNKEQDTEPHLYHLSTKTLEGNTAQFEFESDNLDHNQNQQYGHQNNYLLDENGAYYDDPNCDYYDYEDEEYYEYHGDYDDYYDENEYFDENYAGNDEYNKEPEIGAWQNVLGVHGPSKESEMCENRSEDDYEGEAENFIIYHYKKATGYEPPQSKHNTNHSSKDNWEEYEKAKKMISEYMKVKLAKNSDECFQKMLSYEEMQLLADQIVTGKDLTNTTLKQKSLQNTDKGITFSTDSLVAAANTIREYDNDQWMQKVKLEGKKLKAGDVTKSDIREQSFDNDYKTSKGSTAPYCNYISPLNSESSFKSAKHVLSEEIKFLEQNNDHVSSYANEEAPATPLKELLSEKEKPINKSDRSMGQTDVKKQITCNKAKRNTDSIKLGPDGLPMWTPVETKDDDNVATAPNGDDNLMLKSLEVFQKGDMLEEEDFEDCNDEYNGHCVTESKSGDFIGNWPFPDPHQGLGKYLDGHSSTYMEEFDKWWNIVQDNKKKIADWEFNRIMKRKLLSTRMEDNEKDLKFQNELFWCIERLEETINSGKLNEKKAKDSYKTMVALKNPKTSFIKKRQLMRATFGDYRSKIAKEEKDVKFNSSVTLGDCGRAKKSKYLKMKQCTSSGGKKLNSSSASTHLNLDQTNIADISNELSQRLKASDLDEKTEGQGMGFRFNFKVDTMVAAAKKNLPEEVISKPEADTSEHPKLLCKGLKYVASDNSFRFNFPS